MNTTRDARPDWIKSLRPDITPERWEELEALRVRRAEKKAAKTARARENLKRLEETYPSTGRIYCGMLSFSGVFEPGDHLK